MDFGRLADISQVDFRLPDVDLLSEAFLATIPVRAGKPRVYAGPTGWAMPRWVGRWYPPGTPGKDFLKHYSRQFNTVEHNSTFYAIPDIATVQRWKEDTSDDFLFCPKVPQAISRAIDLGVKGSDLPLFLQNIGMLGEKLGCCFIQLPPQFHTGSLSKLETFLRAWDDKIPLAVEARHASFFDNSLQSRAFFNTLQYHRKTAVITDVAGRRDILHQKLTSERVVIRFVGNGLHQTDYERINDWVQRLKIWFEWGLHEVFFFVHQPDNLLAPELTLYLAEQIERTFAAELRIPSVCKPEDEKDSQMSLF